MQKSDKDMMWFLATVITVALILMAFYKLGMCDWASRQH